MKRPGQLITGTVRGRRGAAYVVALRDGERIEITFDGVETPQIGADVIGVLGNGPDGYRMRLVADVTRMLLKGKARIISTGRPDLTARMLASLLVGAGPAAIRAGTGGLIERTPTVEDPDLAWALAIMAPVSHEVGLALNVIDPVSLAQSDWSDAKLRDETLPADAAGETAALADLKLLLADGMRPSCSRTVEELFGGVKVPSVDFVMPFSPLATGFSYSAEIAGARRNEIVGIALSGQDARRLSSLREMSRAFSQRYLGDAPSDPFAAAELEASFADAAATLAYLANGGRPAAAFRYQRLRESALLRYAYGDRPNATGDSIAQAIRTSHHHGETSMDKIFQIAASIAHNHAAKTLADWTAAKPASDKGVFVDLSAAPAKMVSHFAKSYREDLAETAVRLGQSDIAIERLERFGSLAVPIGFEEEFDAALYLHMPDRVRSDDGVDFAEMLAGEPDFSAATPSPAPGL